MCEKSDAEKVDLLAVGTLPQGDVSAARASAEQPRASDSEVPPKKRKTRRGKSKRKNVHPYRKGNSKSNMKPEAPYNSNRFLIEDHGDLDNIDEELRKTDQASTSTVPRTRDSSVSVDSDAEFYSTPDDEEVFLIKDFDNQYESLQAERLQAMSKDELIQEFLLLESKVEALSKRLQGKSSNGHPENDMQKEIERLVVENETLKRENESLRTKLDNSSDSADSETDSYNIDSSSSSSMSSLSGPESPLNYAETNGHAETPQTV